MHTVVYISISLSSIVQFHNKLSVLYLKQCPLFTDKQQELDIPSLHVEDAGERVKQKKDRPRHATASSTMSQVSF